MAERQKNMQNKMKMTLENEANQKVICFAVFVEAVSFFIFLLVINANDEIYKNFRLKMKKIVTSIILILK